MDVFWQKKGRTKTTPNKSFQTKTSEKTSQTRTPQTKTNLHVKTYVCMHVLLKIGGSEMCDVLWGFRGCDNVWQGRGQNWSKIAWHTLWTLLGLHIATINRPERCLSLKESVNTTAPCRQSPRLYLPGFLTWHPNETIKKFGYCGLDFV